LPSRAANPGRKVTKMYKAMYTHENLITGEITHVEETFASYTDAQTFIEQAQFSYRNHSLEWENRDIRIEELA